LVCFIKSVSLRAEKKLQNQKFKTSDSNPFTQGFLIKMECVVFAAFVMAEDHLCITYGRILDAEVAFGHDKSHLRCDKYHFYIFMRKPFPFTFFHRSAVNLLEAASCLTFGYDTSG
jgi:hypothetical protein